jgi:hypothetical protein
VDVIEMWWLSLAIAAVVVVVVAVLLGLIIAAAKSVDQHASAIWTEGKKIAGNTVSIWMLEKTNEYAHKIWQSADALEMHAHSMNEKLETLAGRR